MSAATKSGSQPPRPGFWRRQFTGRSTWGQAVFDILFAVVGPLACLAMDPGVFVGTNLLFSRPLIGWPLAAYGILLSNMALLAAWLPLQGRMRGGAGFFAGAFFAAAAFSGFVEVMMAPMFPLCVTGIGLLVLVPAATCFVYARNAWRALRRAEEGKRPAAVAWLAICGVALTAALPLGLDFFVRTEIASMVRKAADRPEAFREKDLLAMQNYNWYPDRRTLAEPLLAAYLKDPEPEIGLALGRAYLSLTGVQIEDEVSRVMD